MEIAEGIVKLSAPDMKLPHPTLAPVATITMAQGKLTSSAARSEILLMLCTSFSLENRLGRLSEPLAAVQAVPAAAKAAMKASLGMSAPLMSLIRRVITCLMALFCQSGLCL